MKRLLRNLLSLSAKDVTALIFGRRILRFLLLAAVLFAGTVSHGCVLLRTFAGANVDLDQLHAAREATALNVRLDGARRLSDRMAKGDSITNADLTFFFSEQLINNAAAQLDSTSGWLDSLTSYTIKSIRVKLYNGSAIATITMAAFNHRYDVDVNLVMDCLLSFSIDSGTFYARLEPFNVVPTVKAGGAIASFEGIIQDIVTMKLSTLSNQLPPIQFPVDFNNRFPVQGGMVAVRSGMNLDISTPTYSLMYSLELKDVLIFQEKLFVAFDVKRVRVEQ